MNKRFCLGFIVIAIYVVIYEWAFHGGVLGGAYQATANIWRPQESMMVYMPWMWAGQLLFAFMFCLIFTCLKCQAGVKTGALYGLVIGLLMSSGSLIFYAVLPVPLSLLIWWVVGGLLETVIAGIIFAAIYCAEKQEDEPSV